MFELATRRWRGLAVAALISVSTALILLGQPLSPPGAVYAAPAEQAKPTTHPTVGRENCLMCHQAGAGVKPAPSDHAGRANEACLMCHKTQAAAPANPAAPAPAKEQSVPAAPAKEQSAPAAPAKEQQPPAQPAGQPSTAPAAKEPPRTAEPAKGQPQVAAPAKESPAPEPTKDQIGVQAIAASVACRSCHNKPEFEMVSSGTSRPDTVKQLETDRVYAHRFIACVTCHTTDAHATMAPVTKNSIAEACGQCHVSQRQEHEKSIHGQSLASGGRDAATCIDCHSTQDTPHSIARVLSPDSPAYRGGIASTCAKCHSKTEVMSRYGVPTEVYKTYMTTFHGKANVLSPYEITQHPKATCVNCHGYHDIKSAEDPTSPTSHSNLANTCGGCHPGAGDQFASGWLGHKEATPQQFPAVYFAERFFFFFTSSVITFGFIFMVALELGSWILRRKPTYH